MNVVQDQALWIQNPNIPLHVASNLCDRKVKIRRTLLEFATDATQRTEVSIRHAIVPAAARQSVGIKGE